MAAERLLAAPGGSVGPQLREGGHARPAGDACNTLLRGTIACYPPVWGIDLSTGLVQGAAREASLRTVVSTEAVATCLGASALVYGDQTAALCDPYYPKHARLKADEAATVVAWRHFALRCRDLFLEGEDTSWYEIDDENGAVAVGSGRAGAARAGRRGTLRPGGPRRGQGDSRSGRPDGEPERAVVGADREGKRLLGDAQGAA